MSVKIMADERTMKEVVEWHRDLYESPAIDPKQAKI